MIFGFLWSLIEFSALKKLSNKPKDDQTRKYLSIFVPIGISWLKSFDALASY